MSWNDFYRRRDVIDTVLTLARRAPEGELPFAEVPGAEQAFGSRENLLLALHYKWTQVLSGYLRAELAGPEDVPDSDRDRVDAVTRAWHRAVREHGTLRRLLDANLDRYPALHPLDEAEKRMLAISTGLADPHEPADEVRKIGAAFVALLHHSPRSAPARRRNPVGHLLRMLAPAG
ncbi:hypothetical protein SAMN05216266_1093 [Amycolatopsis marina]|uniref:Uncharacterized protein n=1 Tax=Amycolatopsis marina TaxID=490629 RepID=A0A1I1ACI1_9PSEU|nr:hypothetical protein [Amycolatopsis marina]SFB35715.1 hypothetical protein SAMN05216266_1093 [Amycolatopsis marina]